MPVSVPVSLFLGPPPGPATGKPSGRTGRPGGGPLQTTCGNWQELLATALPMPFRGLNNLWVNPGICSFCWQDQAVQPDPDATFGWSLAGNAPGEDSTNIITGILQRAGWNQCGCNDQQCQAGPGGGGPPTPTPTPTPIQTSGQPGTSCDSPLFVQVCGPGAPTTTPPPTPTQSPGPCDPATDPSCSQPGPLPSPGPGQGGASICDYTSVEQFLREGGAALANTDLAAITAIGEQLTTVPVLGDALKGVVSWLIDSVGENLIPPACDPEVAGPAATARAAIATIDRWTGSMPEAARILGYVVSASCPTILPSPEEADTAYLRGVIGEEEWRLWVSVHGHCVPQHLKVLEATRPRPAVSDADTAYLAGVIDEREWYQWVDRTGYPSEQMALVLGARRAKPSAADYVRLWWRGQISFAAADQGVRELGYTDQQERQLVIDAAQAWPTAQDFLRLYWRGEVTDELPDLLASVGLVTDESRQRVIDASAIWISPGQAVQAYQRFRAGRDTTWDDPATQSLQVTEDDLDRWLGGSQYPSEFRPILAGLGTVIPGIRQALRGLQTGVWTEARVAANLRRGGWGEADARDEARTLAKVASDARLRQILSTSGSLFARAWELGTLDDAGVLSDFRGLGLSEQEAAVALTLTRARYLQARVERQLRVLRAGFLRGTFSEDDVRAQLSRSAIVPDRIDDYISDWTLELEGRRREISIGELVRDACKGIVPVPVLAQRLRSLRMTDDDIAIKLQEVALCVADREVKLLTQQQRAAEKNQRAALSAVKAQKAALTEAQRVLAKHGSPAQLAAWYWEGSIPAGEVYARLDFLGWPDPDIARLLQQHEPKPKAAGSSKGHSGSGAGAPGG